MSQTRISGSNADVPLKIDGAIRNIKGVTKYTTFGDVIKMVLKKSAIGKENRQTDSYGIFESSRGIERLLPGKCRILKVMRSWGSADEFEFVFRKVNPVISVPKISEAKRRKLMQKPRDTAQHARRGVNYGSVASLPSSSHFKQTTRTYNEADKNNGFVKEIYSVNHDSNCENNYVTESRELGCQIETGVLNRLSSASHVNFCKRNITGRSDRQSASDLVDSHNVTVTTNVNHVKYAVRKTLKPKKVSLSDISSVSKSDEATRRNAIRTKLQPIESQVSCSSESSFAHSTPCQRSSRDASGPKRRHEQLADHISSKIAKMSQREGKEAILRKYFSDYIAYQSPNRPSVGSSRYREQGDGAESGIGTDNRCHGDGSEYATTWRSEFSRNTTQNLDEDSDSGQEEDTSQFDRAFIDTKQIAADDKFTNACKLVDYSFSESECDESVVDDIADISAISGDQSNVSSLSDIVRNVFNENIPTDEDEEMESFMKTKLYDEYSDEGLSSLGSEDGKEILV